MTGSKSVLTLHGYSQCADTFNQKSGPIRRLLKKLGYDTVHLEAPLVIAEEVKERSWFKFKEDYSQYYEFDNAIDYVVKYLNEHPEIEGIIGFSQGACLLGALSTQLTKFPNNIKFIIVISGFLPAAEDVKTKYYGTDKITVPSMHIYGKEDPYIECHRSISLAEVYQNPTCYEHPGKHFVPSNAASMKEIQSFLSTLQK